MVRFRLTLNLKINRQISERRNILAKRQPHKRDPPRANRLPQPVMLLVRKNEAHIDISKSFTTRGRSSYVKNTVPERLRNRLASKVKQEHLPWG
jgi:hypothetical protein